jgi:hypothetical protein
MWQLIIMDNKGAQVVDHGLLHGAGELALSAWEATALGGRLGF